MLSSTKAKVVFASGVFDLFHYGHLRFLEQAAALGDTLLVGVQTDERVIQSKGEAPIYPLHHRLSLVDALDCVDMAFPVEGPEDEMRVVLTDIAVWAIGPEYDQLAGHESLRQKVEALGVRYVEIPRTLGISTTEIKEWCKQ